MAAAFVLNAQLNLNPPRNVSAIVSNIQRQLGRINANINLRVNPATARAVSSLNSAINNLNSSLSTLSVNTLAANAGLNTLLASLRANGVSLRTVSSGLSRTSSSLNNVASSANNAGDAVERFARSGLNAIKRYSSFAAATTGIYALIGAVKNGIGEAVEFQNELVKISQVTGTSTKDLRVLEKEITRLSTSLGVSSLKLVNVAQILAQAGLSAREVKIGLEALAKTNLAATFSDVEKTVEGAIASMRQFNIGVGDLEKTLGSFNTVAGAFAVESDDIVTAVRRAGASFAASGGTLNEFIALFTSVRQTTRESAETIATGFRTIFTRFQRPKTIEFLRELGIELTDVEGKFVGPYEAIRRLSEGLKSIDTRDLRFAEVVEELGGFRQVSKVIPLIQQFAVAERALGVAIRGETSLTRDAIVAQQSFLVQLTRLREEFYSLFRTIGNDSSVQAFGKLMIELARNAIKLAEALTPLIPVITTIGAVKLGGAALSIGRSFGKPRGFARGGIVPGQGSGDTVPAMLTPGEFVLTKKAVQGIGASNLSKVNKYAQGGLVRAGYDTRYGLVSLDRAKPGYTGEEFTVGAKDVFGPGKLPDKVKRLKQRTSIVADSLFDTQAETDAALDSPEIKLRDTLRGLIRSVGNKLAQKVGGTAVNVSHIPNEASIIGGIFEGALNSIGNPYDSRIDSVSQDNRSKFEQRTFDFPTGLNFGVLQGIRTEAKKSINKDSVRSLHSKIIADLRKNLDPEISKEVELLRASGVAPKVLKETGTKGESAKDKIIKQFRETGVVDPKTFGLKQQEVKAILESSGTPFKGRRGSGGFIFTKFAKGGGVGTDTVPALLTPGEFVVNKKSAQSIGYGNLNRMNRIHKYASGGVVQKFANGGQARSGFSGAAAGLGISIIAPTVLSQVSKIGGVFEDVADSAGSLVAQFSLLATVMASTGKGVTLTTQQQVKNTGTMTAIGLSKFGVPLKRGAQIGRSAARIAGGLNATSVVVGTGASLIGNAISGNAAKRLDAGDASAAGSFTLGRAIGGAGTGAASGALIGSVLGPFGAAIGGVVGGLIGLTRALGESQEEINNKLQSARLEAGINKISTSFEKLDKGILSFAAASEESGVQLNKIVDEFITSPNDENRQRAFSVLQQAESQAARITSTISSKAVSGQQLREDSTFNRGIRAQAAIIAGGEGLGGNALVNRVNQLHEQLLQSAEKELSDRKRAEEAAKNLIIAQNELAERIARFSGTIDGLNAIFDNGGTKLDDAINSISGGKIQFGLSTLASPENTKITGRTFLDRVYETGQLSNRISSAFGGGRFGEMAGSRVSQTELASSVLPTILRRVQASGIEATDDTFEKELRREGIKDKEVVKNLLTSFRANISNRQGEGVSDKTPEELAREINQPNIEVSDRLRESLRKQEEYLQKLDEIFLKRVQIEEKATDAAIAKSNLEQRLFETNKRFQNLETTGQDVDLFVRKRRRILAGDAGRGVNLSDPSVLGQRIRDLNAATVLARRNALSGGVESRESTGNAVRLFENEANRLTRALADLANNTETLTALEADLAKEEEKRATRRQFVEDIAFAGNEGRKKILDDVRNAFIVARNPLVAGTSEQEGSALRILKQFENLNVFDGKTGQQVINQRIEAVAKQIALSSGRTPEQARAIAQQLINPTTKEDKLREAITTELQKMIAAQEELRKIEETRLQSLDEQTRDISANVAKIANERTVNALPKDNTGNAKGLAYGGRVGGVSMTPRGTDTVPAMLTPGEFVINRKAAKTIGYETLMKMNTMYAARGGKVDAFGRTGRENYELKLKEKIEENNARLAANRARLAEQRKAFAANPPKAVRFDAAGSDARIAAGQKRIAEEQAQSQIRLADARRRVEEKQLRSQKTIARNRATGLTNDEYLDRLRIASRNDNTGTFSGQLAIHQQGEVEIPKTAKERKQKIDELYERVAAARTAKTIADNPYRFQTNPFNVVGNKPPGAFRGMSVFPSATDVNRPNIPGSVPQPNRQVPGVSPRNNQQPVSTQVNKDLVIQNADVVSQASKNFLEAAKAIPSSINLDGSFKPIEVIINGAEALASMQPGLEELIEIKINEALAEYGRNELEKETRPVYRNRTKQV